MGIKTEQRVEAGVHFLVWLTVYACAIVVVFLDLLYWRPN